MSREKIYDEQIGPLMQQIIAICKEHDIPVVASFDLDDDRDTQHRVGLKCTTYVCAPNADARLRAAGQLLVEGFAAVTVVTRGPPPRGGGRPN